MRARSNRDNIRHSRHNRNSDNSSLEKLERQLELGSDRLMVLRRETRDVKKSKLVSGQSKEDAAYDDSCSKTLNDVLDLSENLVDDVGAHLTKVTALVRELRAQISNLTIQNQMLGHQLTNLTVQQTRLDHKVSNLTHQLGTVSETMSEQLVNVSQHQQAHGQQVVHLLSSIQVSVNQTAAIAVADLDQAREDQQNPEDKQLDRSFFIWTWIYNLIYDTVPPHSESYHPQNLNELAQYIAAIFGIGHVGAVFHGFLGHRLAKRWNIKTTGTMRVIYYRDTIYPLGGTY